MTPTKRFPSALKAARHLREVDPRLAEVIDEVGPMKIAIDRGESVFESLATSIIYQQIHGKAAAAILKRFKETCGANDGFPDPKLVLQQSTEALKASGLSQSKMIAILDLSQKVLDGTVPTRDQAHRMTNEELIESLVEVRGIGTWTAQMMLIFTLRRGDVLPVLDFGVRKGFAAVYGKRRMPTPKQLEKHGEKWAPHRSVAAWYFWRALELERFKKVKILP